MSIKVNRKIQVLYNMYEYYIPCIEFNNLISKIEIYGYEIDLNNNILHGFFDNKNNINSLLLISTCLISKFNPKIIPKIFEIDLQNLSNVFNLLKDTYISDIKDLDEIIFDNKIVINDFIVKKLNVNEYNIIDIPLKISLLVNNMFDLNNKINTEISYDRINNFYNKYSFYRKNLLMLGAKEIMTHPIIDINTGDKNKLKHGYLSHNYVRNNIFESFVYEYNEYNKYNFIFEIADCFNLIKFRTYKHIFIGINNTDILDINNLIFYSGISSRFLIINNEIYSFNSMGKLIGIYNEFKGYKCLEIFIEKLFHFCQKPIYFKVYDFNILNFITSDIALLYMLCIRIQNIKILDIYKTKYTIRIYTCISYTRIVYILKRLFTNRLLL